jgi:hypothetical protein
MEMKWHRVALSCPTPNCGREPTILAFSCAADGSVMLEMICVKCGIKLAWKSDVVKLITIAFNSDLQVDTLLHKPLRPPINDPCMKIADDKFLRMMHIDPNDPNLLEGV